METLEEAAENYNLNTINAFGDYESFIAGAKWQQERSYSEEEVMTMLYCFHYDLVNSNIDTKEEWFEQFKKK
jgi:hypothetical protein